MNRLARFVAPLSRAAAAPLPLQCTVVQLRHFATKKGEDQIKVEFENKFSTYMCDGPQNSAVTNKTQLLDYFRQMSLMRRVEIVADNLYKAKKIRGFCHLYDGQEAITVGMEAAITKKDSIITAYRDHTTQMGRGDSAKSVLAELLGRRTGCSQGKGGSMHMYLVKSNFYGGNGIVGAQVPVGAGIAFAHKYRGEKNVCFAMYGDGAANQGQIFEAANMAALWKLPLIFVCENNLFGMGTSAQRGSAQPEFYKRGSYIPGVRADGMDVLAVRTACEWASSWCREGKGPLFLEFVTYRYHGHSMSDPGTTYRTREEVQQMRERRDPINRVRKLLLDNNWSTPDDLKAIDREVKQEVEEAAAFAEQSPEPDDKELVTNIYTDETPKFIRTPVYQNSFFNAVASS